MNLPIRRAGVIGAGVMGSGIAAHFANAGVEVILLDIVPPDLNEKDKADPKARNRFAAGGLEKALKSRPAAFFHKGAVRLVSVGNTEDDLAKLGTCDLVIEAVLERMDVKRALFEKLEKVVGKDCIVASNTSGLRIDEMLQGRSENFQKNFLVIHFFNPVRYMKLLELVPGPKTDPATFERVRRFGEDRLGKGVVVGKDTPNFVANRIGTNSMMRIIHLLDEEGLVPEDVDAITGVPMGNAKSGSFRTADLVGIDTLVHVADNCYASLVDDEERDVFKMPSFVRGMVEKKILGDKTKGGFYKKDKAKGEFFTIDTKTLEYRPKAGDAEIKKVTKDLAKIEDPRERVRKLINDPSSGKAGTFAWKALSHGLAYTARRVGEISDDLASIDDAMRWGYNREIGPFETWDALGFVETTDRMLKDGVKLPASILKMKESGAKSFYRTENGQPEVYDLVNNRYVPRKTDPRNATLTILRKGNAPVLKNDGAEAWDLGDGILGLTMKTKANSLDADVIEMLDKAAAKAETDFRGLVIANQGENFCVGANLFLIVMNASQGQWDDIRKTVKSYQAATQRLKYATVPVVVAPFGMTLGGGLELCFAGDAVQAAAETYSGLVEVGVGLIPGGAGTLNMLWRAFEGIPEGTNIIPMEFVAQTFKNIAMVKVATSAEEAKQFGYFRKSDGISFDKARLVTEAKSRCVGLASAGYQPPAPRAYTLPGESGIATIDMMVSTLVAGGFASEHDAKIARKLGYVLCGGPGGATHEVTEQEMLDHEAEAFLSLCGEPKSLERMQYMLMNNKPLRN